jgi:hypothetical protein
MNLMVGAVGVELGKFVIGSPHELGPRKGSRER